MNQQNLDSYLFRRLNEEIDLMKQSIESYSRQKPDNYESLIRDCEARIFNALVNLGEFLEAERYAKTSDDMRLLARLEMSLNRSESSNCKCPVDVIPTSSGNAEIPKFFVWRRMYNPKTGLWADVYKCGKCNFMTSHPNANATQSARKLERARSNPELLNARNKKKDDEVLK